MLPAKKQFIKDMKSEAEAYLYNAASLIPGFTSECATGLIALYSTVADEAITSMTLIACTKNPEAFCKFVLSRSCSKFLLDPANDGLLFKNGTFSHEGEAILALFQDSLKSIAGDSNSPAGQHNDMQLNFVKGQLRKRMK